MQGIFAAHAEINRDVQASTINPFHFLKYIKVCLFKAFHECVDSFLRRAGLVLIVGILFTAITQSDFFYLHSNVSSLIRYHVPAKLNLPDRHFLFFESCPAIFFHGHAGSAFLYRLRH